MRRVEIISLLVALLIIPLSSQEECQRGRCVYAIVQIGNLEKISEFKLAMQVCLLLY